MVTKLNILWLLFGLIIESCAPKQNLNNSVFQDCMKDRKNVETISDSNGTIRKISDTYVIVTQNENMRYVPCNLPESFKKDSLDVTFTVMTKEVKPNERWVGTPCYLLNLESKQK